MRVTEIARVLICDLLLPSGMLRKEVSLRAPITEGCRQRCVFITHQLVIDALDLYIEHRWAEGLGTELARAMYRGLSPETTLILSHKGSSFALTNKRRTLVGGEVEDYWACDALQQHVSRLYRDAGLHDCSSHSGRRTFATRLVGQGHDIEVVQRLLGHAHLDHTDDYLDVNAATIAEMFTMAL